MRTRYLLSLAAVLTLFTPDLHGQRSAPESCDRYEAAVLANPNDLDAAASLGQCSVRDYEMVAPGGDSTRLAFRSSYGIALRALRHAVEVDPAYDRAYRPLFRILFSDERDGCSSVTSNCEHVAPVIRAGDSLVTIPRRVSRTDPLATSAVVIREAKPSLLANVTEARALAERWVKVTPGDRRPHEYLGRALLVLGDPAAASTELESAATLGTAQSRRMLFWLRLEALVRSDRGADARRVLDEAEADPARDTTIFFRYRVAGMNALLGRHRPVPVDTARGRELRERFEARLRNNPPPPPPSPRPPTFKELLAAGDTVGARRLLVQSDSSFAAMEGRGVPLQRGAQRLEGARNHMALGDLAGAEAALSVIERPFTERYFEHSVSSMNGLGQAPWVGRAWLLMGDVAVLRGRPEDAARMYRRVIGLWGGGDADLQPVVEEARAKLTSLSKRQ